MCLDGALECNGDKLRLALNGEKTQNTDIIIAISLMVTGTDNKAHCLNENSGLRNKPKRMTCLRDYLTSLEWKKGWFLRTRFSWLVEITNSFAVLTYTTTPCV